MAEKRKQRYADRPHVQFKDIDPAYRDRLWARIGKHVEIEGECTVYRQHPSSNGYGRISIHGRLYAAHRFVYQYWTGILLRDDQELDHFECHNPACIRASHLKPTSRSGNAKTRRSHGCHHAGTRRSKRWKKQP